MTNHKSGSNWRKWDLHVHTPESVSNRYGEASEEVWEQYVSDLEGLPAEFSVIGVNDYLFLDGYKKLLEFKKAGRLQNIETLIPVVEFRLSKFAGHKKMLRVNYHVLFSEELTPEIIEEQFLSQLKGQLKISSEYSSLKKDWKSVVTKNSLTELGKLIRKSIPLEKLPEYDESDFLLGFNNINFNDDKLVELLDSSDLRGKYLTAIGKAEWDQYNWNDSSIGEKKNVINSADIVFTAAEDIPAFERCCESLKKEGVNKHLLDCSDAHSFSSANDKDRIGNSHTWIKGDTSLNGLILALKDYQERIFIGTRPLLLDNIDQNPSKYIKHISISRRPEFTPLGKWFEDVKLDINPELVAVIGNRGMGKSALLDSISLAGNSGQPIKELSFLKRFRAARGKLAESFEIDLQFHDIDNIEPLPLSSNFDPTKKIMVKHLPQHFIEVICNEANEEFEIEIERVVFSHVPEDKRLNCENLSDLIDYKSEPLDQRILDHRAEISLINEKIGSLEEDLSEHHSLHLTNELTQSKSDLRQMWLLRPQIPIAPKSSNPKLDQKIVKLREDITNQKALKLTKEKRIVELRSNVESAKRISALLDKLERDYSRLASEYSEDFSKVQLLFNDVVKLKINRTPIIDCEKVIEGELVTLKSDLDVDLPKSLAAELAKNRTQLREDEAELSAPLQLYQAARKRHTEFKEKVRQLIGDEVTSQTIKYLQKQKEFLEKVAPKEIAVLQQTRQKKTEELFTLLSQHTDLLKELYTPVQAFIEKHPPKDSEFRVSFNATLEADKFENKFSRFITFNKAGTFYGKEQAHKRIVNMLHDIDFNDWNSVALFLKTIDQAMHEDQRPEKNNESRLIKDQLRPEKSSSDLYDFLYGLQFVGYKHNLTMGGRPLNQLSPGEKGALLLVFYLLIDQSDCPLLIDQPEENLDNQSVYRVLVPFIREARRRRQVILVTHNPNIAVVAAAEQIIFCEMDKSDGNLLKYISGSLENPEMNQYALDVLEGTRPAFGNRDFKYEISLKPG